MRGSLAVLTLTALLLPGSGLVGCKKKAPDQSLSTAPAAAPKTKAASSYQLLLLRDRVGRTLTGSCYALFNERGKGFLEVRGKLTRTVDAVLQNGLWSAATVRINDFMVRERQSESWRSVPSSNAVLKVTRSPVLKVKREDGDPLLPMEEYALKMLFGADIDGAAPTVDDLLGRKEPVKVGDKWTPQSGLLTRELRNQHRDFGIADGVTGDLTIAALNKVGDEERLRLAGALTLKLNSAPNMPDFGGKLTMITSMDVPVNTDAPIRPHSTKYIVKGQGRVDGASKGLTMEWVRRFSNMKTK